MSKQPDFDVAAAHNYFSANCFNAAWDLIDREKRTDEEDRQMILANMASIYHWTQRKDCTDQNLSVGFWQSSRIFSLLNQPENARRFADLSLKYAATATPFFQGYAYEALARAAKIAGDAAAQAEYLAKAKELVEVVTNADERKFLSADLESLE
jgi:hypothetical protein